MDKKTLQAYSENAKAYSDDWLAQPSPEDTYQLLKEYFIPQGKTADIGCGNGRDTAWLLKNDFSPEGFDSSQDLLTIAAKLNPKIHFQQTFLPKLENVVGPYDNVFCETVIMHLEKSLLAESVRNLRRILKVGGVLYLSWRVTEGSDKRHVDGRLYASFSLEDIVSELQSDQVLHFEDKVSESSKKRVCRLIIKKKN